MDLVADYHDDEEFIGSEGAKEEIMDLVTDYEDDEDDHEEDITKAQIQLISTAESHWPDAAAKDERKLRRWQLSERDRYFYQDVVRRAGEAEAKYTVFSQRGDSCRIFGEEIISMLPTRWVRSSCILMYFQILQARCVRKGKRYLFLDPIFWTRLSTDRTTGDLSYHFVQDYSHSESRGINALDMQKILIPMCINRNHYALTEVDLIKRTIAYYDSLPCRMATTYMSYINRWLIDLAGTQRLIFQTEDFAHHHKTTPQQMNGYDCGIYCMMNADFLSDDLEPNLEPEEIDDFRMRILIALITHCLKY